MNKKFLRQALYGVVQANIWGGIAICLITGTIVCMDHWGSWLTAGAVAPAAAWLTLLGSALGVAGLFMASVYWHLLLYLVLVTHRPLSLKGAICLERLISEIADIRYGQVNYDGSVTVTLEKLKELRTIGVPYKHLPPTSSRVDALRRSGAILTTHESLLALYDSREFSDFMGITAALEDLDTEVKR